MKWMLTLLLLAGSLFSYSQTDKSVTTTIHGTIADFNTKKPIKGATIILYNSNSVEINRVKANDRGNFSFGQFNAGTYNLKYEAEGYEAQKRNGLPLKSNKKVRVAVLLKPRAASK